MAKKQTPRQVPSKSDSIRELRVAHPQASAKEIKTKLSAQGIQVSDALINKLMSEGKSGQASKGGKRAKGGKRGHGAKASAIRAAFDEMGLEARPRDVVAALAKKKIKVSAAQVSMLRTKLLSEGNGSAAPAKATAGPTDVTSAVPYEHLLAAKQLAARLGGVSQACKALESFARLMQD